MKFNTKYLSIPPYISTSWENIKSLQMSGNQLLITLSDSSLVRIPDLNMEEIQQLFTIHSTYLELAEPFQNSRSLENKGLFSGISSEILKNDLPFKVGFGASDGAGFGMFQHSSDYASAPDMPQEFLCKIEEIAKILSPEALSGIPKAEPHCNCPHCQVARTIYRVYEGNQESSDSNPNSCQEEIEVSDSDLQFAQWEVIETGEKFLFNVVNKLDKTECYGVYLGSPVGCTCGRQGCEHLLVVLRN